MEIIPINSFLQIGALGAGVIYLFKDEIWKQITIDSTISDIIEICSKNGISISNKTGIKLLKYAEDLDQGRSLCFKRKRENHPEMFRTGERYRKKLLYVTKKIYNKREQSLHREQSNHAIFELIDKKIKRFEELMIPFGNCDCVVGSSS